MRRSLLIILALGTGCHSPAPDTGAAAGAFADILRWRSTPAVDPARFSRGVDSILASHRLTRDSFLQSFDSLPGNDPALEEFLSSASDRLASPGR